MADELKVKLGHTDTYFYWNEVNFISAMPDAKEKYEATISP